MKLLNKISKEDSKNRKQKQSYGDVIGVLKPFSKFTGKILHQSLSFNKVAGVNFFY